jgi:hypothetical protein
MNEAMNWQELSGDAYHKFRRQYVAEIEAVRSALPWRVARRAIDSAGRDCKGYPAYILSHASAKNCYALIWLIKGEGGGEIDKLVGYIEVGYDKGVRCKYELPESVGDEHEFIKSARILGIQEPWQGPCEQRLPEMAEPDATPQDGKSSSSPEEQREAIEKAIREIQENYTVETLDVSQSRLRKRLQSPQRDLNHDNKADRDELNRLQHKVVNFAFPKSGDEAGWEQVSVAAFDLSFYEGCCLYRITDRRGLRSKSGYIVMQRSKADATPVCCLGNTSAPIHVFNQLMIALGKFRITQSTAVDYLIFFCRFVHGELGAFSIIEKADDLRWLADINEETGAGKRRVVTELLEPVRSLTPDIPPEGDAESFYYSAFDCYGRNLFYARFRVEYDGKVEMEDDRPCLMDLPIFPVAFDLETDFVLRPRSDYPEVPR